MMKARDIMTTNVVTVTENTSVPVIARLLIEKRISGVPVVDRQNRVVGIVTESDLLRRPELGTDRRRKHWLELFVPNAQLASEYIQSHGQMAGDVMSHDVIRVAPDAPIGTIVDIFENERINHLPVVENSRLVGIVSRGNLVQALGSISNQISPVSIDDRRIRDLVIAEFARHPWGLDSENNVIVTGGIVYLWGVAPGPEVRKALRVAAAAIPGVRGVQDRMTSTRGDWPLRFHQDPAG